jgi:hypothetical protein
MKEDMWAGNNPVADTSWRNMGLDDTSINSGESSAAAALSFLREAIGIFNYLNSPIVNAMFATAYNGITDALNTYAGRVQAVTGTAYPIADMHRTFFMNVIRAQHLEGSTRNWVERHLNTLENNWLAAYNAAVAQPRPLNADFIVVCIEVLANIGQLRLAMNQMSLDVSRFR